MSVAKINPALAIHDIMLVLPCGVLENFLTRRGDHATPNVRLLRIRVEEFTLSNARCKGVITY